MTGRLAAVVVDEHLAHARGRQRLGDEPGGLVVVGDDVDLLAAQLGDDHAHARAARADARADRVDALLVRDDRDLRAVAGLARDVLDLDEAVGDLGTSSSKSFLISSGSRRLTMIDGPFVEGETSLMTALMRWPWS
jgi:hypothetical protein